MRLAVARALYGSPELLVMDDALAAVDGRVARTIFDKAILARKEKGLSTMIALNQLQFLPEMDKIIFLQDGKISGIGTYEDLRATVSDFAEMVDLAADGDDADLDSLVHNEKTSKAQELGEEQGRSRLLKNPSEALKSAKWLPSYQTYRMRR